jgi:DNA-binding transcriptional LysR family regulator
VTQQRAPVSTRLWITPESFEEPGAENPVGTLEMIRGGFGVGVLPDSMVENDIRSGRLVVIPGPKTPLTNRIAIAQLGDRLPDATQKKFVSVMKGYF